MSNKVEDVSNIPNRVIVLGSAGMLGQMVVKFFGRSEHFDVVKLDTRYGPDSRSRFIEDLLEVPGGWVINCIGKIKQKTVDVNDLFWANSLLPLDLVEVVSGREDLFLIHPSTDCIFNGQSYGRYDKYDASDATDEYGRSKRLGEVALIACRNAAVLRTSIIGPDSSGNAKGLLGWFLSLNSNEKVQGYENHYWNGITTLEWCKQLMSLIDSKRIFSDTLFQLGSSQAYSKYQMLVLFNEVYQRGIEIEGRSMLPSIDRTLVPDPELVCPTLECMMRELTSFEFQ